MNTQLKLLPGDTLVAHNNKRGGATIRIISGEKIHLVAEYGSRELVERTGQPTVFTLSLCFAKAKP